ncbi:MAG: Wzz/FepE/Etk N-terminal domain-containing protein [Chloroflexota bacterium]
MKDKSPQEIFEATLRGWWVLILTTVLAALAGWAFSLVQPPVYEATAYYGVSLDQVKIAERSGLDPATVLPFEFTTLDIYYRPVESVFRDPDTKTQLVEVANADGIDIDIDEFTGHNFYIDRRGSEWFITVRHTDPGTAARLANLWVEVSDSRLRELQAHAFVHNTLVQQRELIENCFNTEDFVTANRCAGTSILDQSQLTAYFIDLNQQIQDEEISRQSIDIAITYQLVQPAELPEQPVLYQRSVLILAGGMIGFLIGTLGLNVFCSPKHKHEPG